MNIGSVVDFLGRKLYCVFPIVVICRSLAYIKINNRSLSSLLGGCPLSGKSSMCMMCLKYRIILLFFFILLTCFLLRGAAPRPAGAVAAPHRQTSWSARHSHIQNLTLIYDHILAVSPSSDQSAVERWRHLTRKLHSKHRICGKIPHYLLFLVVKKQRTNAKSGRTEVSDRQHVGA